MSIQKTQLKAHLKKTYVPKIDNSDIKETDQGKEAKEISRALSAFVMTYLYGTEIDDACRSVVDGYGDNGIDLIHYAAVERTLFLVQSKWSESNKNIDSGDTHKFIKGVQDLCSLQKGKFKGKTLKRWSDIENAISEVNSIRIVVVTNSTSAISEEQREIVENYIDKANEGGEVFSQDYVNIQQLFSFLKQGAEGAPVDVDVLLKNWGKYTEDPVAYYGFVSASDLAQHYNNHFSRLFSKNIRHFVGSATAPNAGMTQTLKENPDIFWHFNNGITAVADEVVRKPMGGADNHSGIFQCKNFSIVNGAQTVGSIYRIWKEDNEGAGKANVQIRIIDIGSSPDELGASITRASNTQNRIDARNFVSLDPDQERLRGELLIEGIDYEYRQGETFNTTENSFELSEATIAIACAQSDVSLVALAKGKISELWADIKAPPYKKLFNGSLNGVYLWDNVKKMRLIAAELKSIKKTEKKVSIPGALFIQHMVFEKIGKDLKFDKKVKAETKKMHKKVVSAISDNYPDSYPGNVFKNQEKCRELKTYLS